MRLLVVDHNALAETGRTLYRALAEYEDMRIRVLVPRAWHDNFRTLRMTGPEETGKCAFLPSPVLFPARTHRLIYLHLRKHIAEFRPDILYMNSDPENFPTLQAAVLVRSRRNIKLFFSTWRNIDFSPRGHPYRLRALHRRAERMVFGRADHAIAFTERARDLLHLNGYPRVTVLPPWVDTSLFRNDADRTARERLGLKDFTVGYVGRFTPEKGGDVLLRAAGQLTGDWNLLLVGDGPAYREWAGLAEQLGIAGRVRWIPPAGHAEIPSYLKAMDVLVLPSRTTPRWKEQFGRVLIEAMACGVPVIGSDSGEIPNVVGDAGLLFDEGDAASLCSRILEYKNNASLMHQSAERGLRRVRKRYAVEVVAPMYHRLFVDSC